MTLSAEWGRMSESRDEMGCDRRGAVFSVLLAAVSLVVPVSVYYIGNGIGAGVAFPLFRYQQTYLGPSLITLFRDIDLVTSGAITGRSALVPFFWLGGVLLCCVALVFACHHVRKHSLNSRRYAGISLFAAGFAFLGGIIAQYGFSFAGSSGFAVPIGALFMCVAGWFIVAGYPGIGCDDDGDEGPAEDEALPGTSGEE